MNLIIVLIFLVLYTMFLFFNFVDFSFLVKRPKSKTKYTQNKLAEEYLYWILNREYISFNNYPTIFPYIYANFKPTTKLEWEEIFLTIKKEFNHLI